MVIQILEGNSGPLDMSEKNLNPREQTWAFECPLMIITRSFKRQNAYLDVSQVAYN